MSNLSINSAFMKLSKRAETNDRLKLVATFVDIGPLFTLLSTKDHQVLYGRRGTGKTHALSYLAEIKQKAGDAVIFIDMRTVGSTGGIYSDNSIPVTQRATRLLVDTLAAIHEGLFVYFIEQAVQLNLAYTGPLLDRLAEAITDVVVVGNIQHEQTNSGNREIGSSSSIGVSVGVEGFKTDLVLGNDQKQQQQQERKITESGTLENRVHFGSVGKVLNEIVEAMKPRRIWILLDEWSSIPLDLQPYLADFLRRSAFPVPNVTIKIAAIEQRSRFKLDTVQGDYIGVELGSDISADLNLDDFMVFDNDANRARDFFQTLLFKHFVETEELPSTSGPRTAVELIQRAFTQQTIFDEFVRATEGVPRDAINIINLAAQRALENRISVSHIRTAARDWYQRDKEAAVRSNRAFTLLHWIIDEVIGKRRARAFLLKSNIDYELINTLFDARLLHVLRKNISAKDQPGLRYDAYKLDYGCYVDLIGTTHAVLGALANDPEDEGGEVTYIEVPPDNYRAIRRAILDIEKFEQAQLQI